MRLKLLLGVVCAMLLLLPAAALAETPSESAYSGTGAVQVETAGENTLPFTGINVAAVGGLALVLLGTGIVVRRTTRPNTD